MQVHRVELVDRSYRDVTVRLALLAKRLEIGDDQFDPEQCRHMEVVASELVLPRDTQPEPEQRLVLEQQGWELPAQPFPRIRSPKVRAPAAK